MKVINFICNNLNKVMLLHLLSSIILIIVSICYFCSGNSESVSTLIFIFYVCSAILTIILIVDHNVWHKIKEIQFIRLLSVMMMAIVLTAFI